MSKSEIKVLVLLSTYNGQNYLQQQLNSLIVQENVELFYLIRDDGSKDGTIEILKQFSIMAVNVELILGKNIGFANSFKELLILSYKYRETVNYFAFCDQDDIWLKNKLHVATNNLEKMSNTVPAMYCSNLFRIDKNNKQIGESYKRGNVIFSKGTSLVNSIAAGCTMVLNLKTIEMFTKHPPKYLAFHDLFIFQMCIFLGEVYYDDIPYIFYRQHDNNVLGDKNTIFLARWKNRLKIFPSFRNPHYREFTAI